MTPVFQNLQKNIADCYSGILLEVSLEQEFPKLYGHGMGSAYSVPATAVRNALSWLWLKWHADHSFSEIRPVISQVASRSLELHSRINSTYFRAEHDSFLLHCVILAGDDGLAKTVAGSVRMGDSKSAGYQYYYAWNGTLASHILGDERAVAAQADIMSRFKPNRAYPWPTAKLVSSFLDRDFKSLNDVLKYTYRKELARLRSKKEKVLVAETADSLMLDFRDRYLNFFWPWPEAAFAKLACRQGATLAFDPLWIPEAFITEA
jgi:hypothetical protein